MKKIKTFIDYIKEDTTGDGNIDALQNNTNAYNKYKSKIVGMFTNAKTEDMEKINKDFDTFIEGLPENEKGASDMIRALFSSEKIKLEIKNYEAQKIAIEEQIKQRMTSLEELSKNLK